MSPSGYDRLVKLVWPDVVWSKYRPEPKNQTWSFQMGPPSVASYCGLTFCGVTSFAGVVADHAAFVNVVRNEPLNALPPDFVTVFTTPPVKRPNSADTDEVDVVVSAIASSMKRLFGVPRMLSVTTAPSTVKRLSKDWPPEIVTTGETPLPIRSLEPGPFVLTPAASATDESSVRVTGKRRP